MRLVLTDFSEDVSVKDPKNVKRYLIFEAETESGAPGKVLRVPIGEEAIAVLVQFLYGTPPEESKPEPQPEPEPEIPEGADEFGGDVQEGEDPDEEDPMEQFELPTVPESEEQVPSL